MIQQLSLNSGQASEDINNVINNKLDVLFTQKLKFTTLMNRMAEKTYLPTYDGLTENLEDKLDCSFNLSQLITLLVFAKTDLDKIERENSQKMLYIQSRISGIIKSINEDLLGYKTISYAFCAEMNAIKELLVIKYPNERYNIR